MIKKIQKIPSALFKEFFRKARRKENDYFKIYYLKNQYDFCRFGIVVSNEVSSKSVLRNKIKRQLRALLKKWEIENKTIKDNFDLIVLVKKSISQDYQSLKDSLFSLLKSVN